MKKLAILLVITLMFTFALTALAEDATQTLKTSPEVTRPATPFGMRRGWRFQQDSMPPASNFTDKDNDGLCDNCGQTPGQNPQAPNFTDENQDGVCDHFNDGSMTQNHMRFMHRQMTQNSMPGMRNRMRQNMPGGMRNRMPGRFGK